MIEDIRALTDAEVATIERDIYAGTVEDRTLYRLVSTLRTQKRVLRELFNLFRAEPLRLVSIADPIRNSTLAYLKELVSMDDPRKDRR